MKTIHLFDTIGDIPAHPIPDQSYYDHLVAVPPDCDRLDVRVSYHRDAPEWDILLVVMDPGAHRGTFGLNATALGPSGDVVLSALIGGMDTTLSKAPGAVPAGVWNLQLWAAHVNQAIHYELSVDAILDAEETTSDPIRYGMAVPSLDRALRAGPGWFRGELHTHTTFSDGWLDPEFLAEHARQAGAEFMAITDHNTIGAWAALDSTLDISIVPALEITLPGGHSNIYGLQRWLDWRVDYRGRTAQEALEAAREQDALISINHPFAPGYSWRYDIPMSLIDCMEIVNYPSWWPAATEYNVMALGLWTSMLNAGHRITAVGGSDVFHLAPGAIYMSSPHPEAILSPATWVYAENDSPAAIMEGLRLGKAYVTMGPTVHIEARSDGEGCGMGEHIAAASGHVEFEVALAEVPAGCRMVLTKNGQVLVDGHPYQGRTSYRLSDTLNAAERNWYRVDLFNAAGEVWAVTNPIYAGAAPQPPVETWSQALSRAHQEDAIIHQTIFE